MGKTYKEQEIYDYHHGKELSKSKTAKLLKYFRRLNFWDWDLKILYRKHKDYVRGGEARIKSKNYKNH